MAYLFYTRFDLVKFQNLQPLANVEVTPGLTSRQFGNIYLLHPGIRVWTNIHLTGKNLIIASADQPLIDQIKPVVNRIDYPDSTPAFYIFER